MPVWTNASNGSWGDSAKWTGGIPNAAGAVAEFTIANPNSALMIVSFPESSLFTIGTLNIVTDADDGWIFRGSTDATSATLRFIGAGGGPAYLNVDTNGSSRETSFSAEFGLRVNFASDVILTTLNSDTTFRISTPITGSGYLYKYGDGTLNFFGSATGWFGDLNLFGGRTEIQSASNIGNATLGFDNSGVLAISGTMTLANRIMVTGSDAVGSIAATAGATVTLSGTLVQATDALSGFRFGNLGDAGTIVLTGSSIVLGDAGFTIAAGVVRIGNANVAANYFSSFSADGLLQIAGTFDTNGFATVVDNLDFDGGTLLTSNGTLNLTVNDNYFSANSQSGTITGTAGVDQIVINATIDWSFSGLGFTSWTNGVDTITINGNADVNSLGGSSQNDIVNGGGGADNMSGGGGSDIYFVDNAGDIVVEGGGQGTDLVYASVSYALTAGQSVEVLDVIDRGATSALNLTGNTLAQTIIGNAGNNMLNGGGGGDTFYGLGGNDTYIVSNASDMVFETAGQGSDTVMASVSYTLTAGQEIEVLDVTDRGATTALNLTGNNLAQTIVGNAGANILSGGGGIDVYYGLGGNDTYMVSSALEVVFEAAGQGSDTILTGVSYTLVAGQSIEVLDVMDRGATTALNLTGNNVAQTIIGNAGANLFNGAGGADIYYGLGGNDGYIVSNASEIVFEAADQGADTVFATVSYTLTAGQEIEVLDVLERGATTGLNLTGNDLSQTIIGNAGANVLNGGAGGDIMHGLGGADTFAFTTAPGGGNIDAIADFSVVDDTIALDDAIFTAIGPLGVLNANAFVTGTQAADASDRIIYNAATGQLLYDADGLGGVAAVQFASIGTGLALTANDFTVI